MTPLLRYVLFGCFAFCGNTTAQELMRFEGPCKSQTPQLRQTVIVLDEALVSPEPSGHPSHLRWTRPILDAADLTGQTSAERLLPRERLSVFLAKRATGDLAPLFVGCSPNIDTAELARLRTERSSLSSFVFGSVEKDLESQRKLYDGAIRDAFAQVRHAIPVSEGPHRNGGLAGLLPALRTLSQTIDLSRGIPRLIVLSPFEVDPDSLRDAKTARESGFAAGASAGLDFRRAEVVGIGFSGTSGQHLQAYAEAFFLRSKGLVVGWRSDGLPQLPSSPNTVRVFGGVADYGDISAPVQIRIASDPLGNLINSGIEVTSGRSLASPI
jgi:hypothetical protein